MLAHSVDSSPRDSQKGRAIREVGLAAQCVRVATLAIGMCLMISALVEPAHASTAVSVVPGTDCIRTHNPNTLFACTHACA